MRFAQEQNPERRAFGFRSDAGASERDKRILDQTLPRYALAIGDVSGKGLSVSLLMATSLSQLDAALALNLSPTERLVHLDQAIQPYTKSGWQNCALCYVEIIPPGVHQGQAVAGKIHIINAGCIPPYIKRATGGVEWPEIGGFALGLGLGTEHGYEESTLDLAKGDIVIMTSDGVVEAHNQANQLLGFERLEAIINSGPHSGAQAMLAHIKSEVFAFAGEIEPRDDLTIIVIQV